jgi:membrane protease YdiL (CAAX protease family)
MAGKNNPERANKLINRNMKDEIRQTLKITLIIAISFGFHHFLDEYYRTRIYDWFYNLISVRVIALTLRYLTVGTPLFVGLFLIHNPKRIINSLGINKGFRIGFLFAFLCTLPMLMGYSIFFRFDSKVSFYGVFRAAICAPFFEELYFRGILFGQLFRFTKIGFIPSVILCALLFASGHLWQSSDPGELIGIFATTFLGAIFFAWAYVEWDNNLWVPVGLHSFMNLHWMLFSAGDNALGGIYANIFRAVTITFVIAGTIRYKKNTGIGLKINRRDHLWINKNPPQ